jgi:hypothetical protein
LLPCPFKTLIAAKFPFHNPFHPLRKKGFIHLQRQVSRTKEKNVKGRHYEAWETKKEKSSPTA